MKIGKLGMYAVILTGLMTLCAPAARAAEPAPKTYADAVTTIQDRMKSIDTAIKAGKLKDVDPDAKVIITLTKSLGELALADGSGVPKDKVKEVSKSAKDLAEMTDMCHDAADEGKADETKQHYAHMVKLVESISQHVKK